MKSIFALSILAVSVLALEMPPMPPMMDLNDKNSKKIQKPQSQKKQTKRQLPKECELLPPMVIFLPPPMEKMIAQCKNELYKPKLNHKNVKKLFGKNAKVDSIKIVEDFSNLYELKVANNSYICNQNISSCFKKSEILKVK